MTRTSFVRRLPFGLLLLVGCLTGCDRSSPPGAPPAAGHARPTAGKPESATADIGGQIESFCGACHATPRPDSFPREMWYDEVRRGFDFYHDSGRTDLVVPIQARVTDYYRRLAPEQLNWGTVPDESAPAPVSFRREPLLPSDWGDRQPPAISFLEHGSLTDEASIWVSDMRSGRIRVGRLESGPWQTLTHPALNPVAVRLIDLNGNRRPEVVIADLASFLPADHQDGVLYWLPETALPTDGKSPSAEPVKLLAEVGRVADLRAGDLDGDGDQDLVVAEFGWHKTGGVHLLWNETQPGETTPRLRHERLDPRPGTIHVDLRDFDRDGRLDIAALLSQEFERIEVWLNRPVDGVPSVRQFERKTLFAVPDPAAGSSGMIVADLDTDGDEDVLYTNGDTFDSFINKPTHGVRWLENRGDWPFHEHWLTGLPGAHRALPADLDQDGDLDLAVVAFVPEKLRGLHGAEHLRSAIWLEQRDKGRFVRHLISREDPSHAAAIVIDADRDGDLDLLAGNFLESGSPDQAPLCLYRNLGRSTPSR